MHQHHVAALEHGNMEPSKTTSCSFHSERKPTNSTAISKLTSRIAIIIKYMSITNAHWSTDGALFTTKLTYTCMQWMWAGQTDLQPCTDNFVNGNVTHTSAGVNRGNSSVSPKALHTVAKLMQMQTCKTKVYRIPAKHSSTLNSAFASNDTAVSSSHTLYIFNMKNKFHWIKVSKKHFI